MRIGKKFWTYPYRGGGYRVRFDRLSGKFSREEDVSRIGIGYRKNLSYIGKFFIDIIQRQDG
jgi:hypothetical protein